MNVILLVLLIGNSPGDWTCFAPYEPSPIVSAAPPMPRGNVDGKTPEQLFSKEEVCASCAARRGNPLVAYRAPRPDGVPWFPWSLNSVGPPTAEDPMP